MVENLTFSQKPGIAVDYAHTVAGPEVPWELGAVAYEAQKATNLGSSGSELRFRMKAATVAEMNTIIAAQISAAPIPTETGFTMDFKPQCRDAAVCEISFTRLPTGAIVQSLAAPVDAFAGPKVLIERSGESIRFESTEVRATHRFKLIASDQASRDASYAAWNKAGLMTRSVANVDVTKDGVVRIESAAEVLKGKMHDRIAFFYGPTRQRAYQIGRTNNITGGFNSEYVDPDLHVASGATEYGFSLLGAILHKSPNPPRLFVPLAARLNTYRDFTSQQPSPEYIATYEKITLVMPAGMTADPRIFECLDFALGTCGSTRQIMTDITREGGKTILYPREAQISGLWLLTADVTGGAFEKPSLWTRFTFGLSNFRVFGKYPRWAFWFWTLSVLGSLVAFIVFFVWLGRRKRRRIEREALRAKEEQVVQDLLKRDPAFNLENFRARAKLIAEKIQHAWSAGDMRECRRFLSQGVYNRFRLQLKIMREHENRQNAMADFRALRLALVERRRSGSYDAVIVRLDAEARDTMVAAELDHGAALAAAKKAPLTTFTEYYTLVRKRNAKTEHETTIDACSHCGTPFTGEGEITKCRSCGAVMGSGTFDWVLAEITQASEYSGGASRKKLAEDVSPDRIEDRASFVFWRQLMARLTGNRAFIARDATDTYLKGDTSRENLYDVAVGAAELESYGAAEAACTAQVRIKWSAADGKGHEVRHRESVLSLSAKMADVVAGGFEEHSCGSCGAPLPETDSVECSYCHSPIQRKNADWLLESVETTIE